MARRPGPSLRALLFGCGAGAVLGQTASFLVGSECDVRHWGPWPAGPVRPSGPCCLAVAQALCWVRQLVFLQVQKATLGSGGRGPQARLAFRALLFGCGAGAVLGQTASFLVGSESDVRHWGPWPAGPVRPSGPCCLAVAQAPFWVRQLVFL